MAIPLWTTCAWLAHGPDGRRLNNRIRVAWQVVAGVLKSEMELDTQFSDHVEDMIWQYAWWPWTELGKAIRPDPGPGIGNVHVSTAKAVAELLERFYGCKYDSPLWQQIREENTARVAHLLVPDDNNIQVVAAYVRVLADYRFGSNGQPRTTDHSNLADWTLADAVAVWHGYRYGVPDVSPGAEGFEDLKAFQNRSYKLEYLIDFVGLGSGARASMEGSEKYFKYYSVLRD